MRLQDIYATETSRHTAAPIVLSDAVFVQFFVQSCAVVPHPLFELMVH